MFATNSRRFAVVAIRALVILFVSAFVDCGLFNTSAIAFDDWPHWRGPNFDAKSTETGLLKEWPEGGPTQLWVNKNSGLGYSGFSIVGDQLFTIGMEDNREFGLCLNANTGKEIWRTPLNELPGGGPRDGGYYRQWGDGPRSTPTVDGECVYVLGAGGHLAGLEKSEGSKLWSVELQEFGGEIPTWGYSESPLVDGNKLICTPGGDVGTILALNKSDGKKVWQTKPIKRVLESDGSETKSASRNYSSIVPINWNNQRQYIQLTEHAIVSVHPENGDFIWQSMWRGKTAVIPSPIFIPERGEVYATSGYNVGSKLLKINDDNSIEERWFSKSMQNHHGGVIQVGDYFYGSSKPVFVCQSIEDGSKKWATRKIPKGALGYADGLFYHLSERSGKVSLIEATEKSVKPKGSFVPKPKSTRRAKKGLYWTHPVVSNGKLYLRDQEMIYCYDIKSK